MWQNKIGRPSLYMPAAMLIVRFYLRPTLYLSIIDMKRSRLMHTVGHDLRPDRNYDKFRRRPLNPSFPRDGRSEPLLRLSTDFQAAFLPGALFLLSKWYKADELSLRYTILYCGNLISNAFGSLIAAGVLANMKGVLGHAAWRWLFYSKLRPRIIVTYQYESVGDERGES